MTWDLDPLESVHLRDLVFSSKASGTGSCSETYRLGAFSPPLPCLHTWCLSPIGATFSKDILKRAVPRLFYLEKGPCKSYVECLSQKIHALHESYHLVVTWCNYLPLQTDNGYMGNDWMLSTKTDGGPTWWQWTNKWQMWQQRTDDGQDANGQTVQEKNCSLVYSSIVTQAWKVVKTRKLESSQCCATCGWCIFWVKLVVKMRWKPMMKQMCFNVEKQNCVGFYTVLVCSHNQRNEMLCRFLPDLVWNFRQSSFLQRSIPFLVLLDR